MDNPRPDLLETLRQSADSVRLLLGELASLPDGSLQTVHPAGRKAKEELGRFVQQLYLAGREQAGEASPGCKSSVAPFIDSPVFIGGAHKSGTTLLRNMMDGHSRILTLPTDGLGFRWLRGATAGDPVACEQEVYAKLARSLIAPMPGTEPTWILGGDVAAYIGFARAFVEWSREFGSDSTGILKAAVCAFHAAGHATEPEKATAWVDKSTANVENAIKLTGLFPRARFINIVRHPASVIAAQKKKQPLKGKSFGLQDEIAMLQRVMNLGVKNVERLGKSRYHLVRYEDLVRSPGDVMTGIAGFLGVPFEPILVMPTVNGHPAGSNTAYRKEQPTAAGKISLASVSSWETSLSQPEITVIMGCFHTLLRLYGYEYEKPSLSQYVSALRQVRRMYAQAAACRPVSMVTGVRCWMRGLLSVGATQLVLQGNSQSGR